jgi:hypothetical protein
MIYGDNAAQMGSFRQGFFVFLFLAIYLIPAVIIVCTCARISMALLKPWHVTKASEGGLDSRVTRRQEENKRKVKIELNFLVSCVYKEGRVFYL